MLLGRLSTSFSHKYTHAHAHTHILANVFLIFLGKMTHHRPTISTWMLTHDTQMKRLSVQIFLEMCTKHTHTHTHTQWDTSHLYFTCIAYLPCCRHRADDPTILFLFSAWPVSWIEKKPFRAQTVKHIGLMNNILGIFSSLLWERT